MKPFPAVLQYYPRKVAHLNGSQNWFSWNSTPAISHLGNPVTVEGNSWVGLWCEWKHGRYCKSWSTSTTTAIHFNTYISTRTPQFYECPSLSIKCSFLVQKNKHQKKCIPRTNKPWISIHLITVRDQCSTWYFWIMFGLSALSLSSKWK